MNCTCKTDLEAKLTERYVSMEPTATGHKVELQGYGIALTETGCEVKGFMQYETFANVPLKKGGSKPKKTTGNMFFSYCPFCGKEPT